MVKNKITSTFLPFDLRDKVHRFGPDQDQILCDHNGNARTFEILRLLSLPSP